MSLKIQEADVPERLFVAFLWVALGAQLVPSIGRFLGAFAGIGATLIWIFVAFGILLPKEFETEGSA